MSDVIEARSDLAWLGGSVRHSGRRLGSDLICSGLTLVLAAPLLGCRQPATDICGQWAASSHSVLEWADNGVFGVVGDRVRVAIRFDTAAPSECLVGSTLDVSTPSNNKLALELRPVAGADSDSVTTVVSSFVATETGSHFVDFKAPAAPVALRVVREVASGFAPSQTILVRCPDLSRVFGAFGCDERLLGPTGQVVSTLAPGGGWKSVDEHIISWDSLGLRCWDSNADGGLAACGSLASLARDGGQWLSFDGGVWLLSGHSLLKVGFGSDAGLQVRDQAVLAEEPLGKIWGSDGRVWLWARRFDDGGNNFAGAVELKDGGSFVGLTQVPWMHSATNVWGTRSDSSEHPRFQFVRESLVGGPPGVDELPDGLLPQGSSSSELSLPEGILAQTRQGRSLDGGAPSFARIVGWLTSPHLETVPTGFAEGWGSRDGYAWTYGPAGTAVYTSP